MKPVLYTQPSCPRCKVIKFKLDEKKVDYDICEDVEEMQKLGLMSTPAMKTPEGKLITDFANLVHYIEEL